MRPGPLDPSFLTYHREISNTPGPLGFSCHQSSAIWPLPSRALPASEFLTCSPSSVDLNCHAGRSTSYLPLGIDPPPLIEGVAHSLLLIRNASSPSASFLVHNPRSLEVVSLYFSELLKTLVDIEPFQNFFTTASHSALMRWGRILLTVFPHMKAFCSSFVLRLPLATVLGPMSSQQSREPTTRGRPR